jgi:hypothetical protein
MVREFGMVRRNLGRLEIWSQVDSIFIYIYMKMVKFVGNLRLDSKLSTKLGIEIINSNNFAPNFVAGAFEIKVRRGPGI